MERCLSSWLPIFQLLTPLVITEAACFHVFTTQSGQTTLCLTHEHRSSASLSVSVFLLFAHTLLWFVLLIHLEVSVPSQ